MNILCVRADKKTTTMIHHATSIHLKHHLDEGIPSAEDFTFQTHEIDPTTLIENDILVQVLAMSADPYLRGRIKSTGEMKPGDCMSGFVAGKVIASKNPAWEAGDLIGAGLPFQTVQIVSGFLLSKTVSWKLTGLIDESEISFGVGVLGMPGSTAYGGLIDVLRPNPGETIFISAASGAVGSLVGMIAKHKYGCTVIGSAGGPAKCTMVKEVFGFDHAIDYKTVSTADELVAALKEVAPGGIDMYFENVGGIHFDAALATLRVRGRIAVCGQISEYNSKEPTLPSFNPMKLIYTFQRIEGFMCMPWLSGKQGNFLADMPGWLREGKVVARETVFEGIHEWPNAFRSLFTGANTCKVVVKV